MSYLCVVTDGPILRPFLNQQNGAERSENALRYIDIHQIQMYKLFRPVRMRERHKIPESPENLENLFSQYTHIDFSTDYLNSDVIAALWSEKQFIFMKNRKQYRVRS